MLDMKSCIICGATSGLIQMKTKRISINNRVSKYPYKVCPNGSCLTLLKDWMVEETSLADIDREIGIGI